MGSSHRELDVGDEDAAAAVEEPVHHAGSLARGSGACAGRRESSSASSCNATAYHVVDDGAQRFTVLGRIDYVWAENRDTGEALPRIPPLRFGGSAIYERGPLSAQVDVLRAQSQHRVSQDELPTDGYTMLNLSFTYALASIGPFTPLVFLRMSNLADEAARESTSFLKDIAPLPGRSFSGGIRVAF